MDETLKRLIEEIQSKKSWRTRKVILDAVRYIIVTMVVLGAQIGAFWGRHREALIIKIIGDILVALVLLRIASVLGVS